jgi:multicomponent Na+:H+ antiporter subunit G
VIATLVDGLSWVLLVGGGFFYLVGAVGLTRMPDVFTRMHAVSVGDTLGAGLLVAGMVLQAGPTLVAAKLIVILLVLLYTGSVATHALARAALQDDLNPLISGPDGSLAETPVDRAEPVEAFAATDRGAAS